MLNSLYIDINRYSATATASVVIDIDMPMLGDEEGHAAAPRVGFETGGGVVEEDVYGSTEDGSVWQIICKLKMF